MTTRKRVFERGTATVERRITFTEDEARRADAEAAGANTSLSELLIGRALDGTPGISPAEVKDIGSEIIGVREAVCSAVVEYRRQTGVTHDAFTASMLAVADQADAALRRIKP